jgi:type I restriction-modification system DNA methylase subunit
MITGEIKSKVDRIWDTMWSGGISNPLSVIEQLTCLLFIKRLDELHTLKERKAARTGKPIEEPVFAADQEHLRWSRFKETAPETMFTTVRDAVFPFIKSLGRNGNGSDGDPDDSTYTQHMKDAIFMMPAPRVLANVVDQLDSIEMTDTDTKGDLYEYMLGKEVDGFSLDDKRNPHPDKSDLPDILSRWGRRDAEEKRKRTDQSFFVPKAEIAGNDYDLSINRYKEVEYEAVDYDPPQVILARLAKLEEEIAEGRKELERFLG